MTVNDRFEIRGIDLRRLCFRYGLVDGWYEQSKSSVYLTGRYFRAEQAKQELREQLDRAHDRVFYRSLESQ